MATFFSILNDLISQVNSNSSYQVDAKIQNARGLIYSKIININTYPGKKHVIIAYMYV
jgi:hypothetical protein